MVPIRGLIQPLDPAETIRALVLLPHSADMDLPLPVVLLISGNQLIQFGWAAFNAFDVQGQGPSVQNPQAGTLF